MKTTLIGDFTDVNINDGQTFTYKDANSQNNTVLIRIPNKYGTAIFGDGFSSLYHIVGISLYSGIPFCVRRDNAIPVYPVTSQVSGGTIIFSYKKEY